MHDLELYVMARFFINRMEFMRLIDRNLWVLIAVDQQQRR